MRQLSYKDFEMESKNWIAKFNEFCEKSRAINIEEREVYNNDYNGDSSYFDSDDYKKFSDRNDQLKKEYKGYTDRYKDADFYCFLSTPEEIDSSNILEDTKYFVKNNLGKIIGNKTTFGKLVGVAVTIEDCYYVVEYEDGKRSWMSFAVKVVGV